MATAASKERRIEDFTRKMMDSLGDMNNFMETETESSQELIQVNDPSLSESEQIKIELNGTPVNELSPSLTENDFPKVSKNICQKQNETDHAVGSEFKTTAMATEDGNTLVIPADELAQMLSMGQVEGLEFEQVNAGNEADPNSVKSRMARLVPVPGSEDSYYLSYEDTDGQNSGNTSQSIDIDDDKQLSSLTERFTSSQLQSEETQEDAEVLQNVLVTKHKHNDSEMESHKKTETMPVQPVTEEVVPNERTQTDQNVEDFASGLPAIKLEDKDLSAKVKKKPKKVTVIPPLPDSVSFTDKVSFLSQHHEKLCQNYLLAKGIKRFSGAWKKPPKDETLLKTRMDILGEIRRDFTQLCHTCFEERHEGESEMCPLLCPQWIIPNVEGGHLKLETPDEILFGMSRMYPGLQSLFARDEIPALTQFGPLKGRKVSIADLASMGVVKNAVDVSNLWPLPVESNLHEFDLENFIFVKYMKETNWLKFMKVANHRDENFPHNVQTVYKEGQIYFVTTREIEPGAELFLRAMEPPFRVYYNMHRLGEVDYDFCSRGKCKPENPTPEHRHLKLHNLVNFVRHQLLVHTSQFGVFSWAAIYNCQHCGEDCFDKENYIKHNQLRHGDTKTKKAANICRFCHLRCNSKNILYHHIRLQHAKEPHLNMYCCEICGKRFKNKDYLRHHHKSSHETEPTSCKLCNKLFQNPTKVRHHMRKVHLRPDQMKVCAICGAIYKDSWALKIHMKKHTQPLQKVAPMTTKYNKCVVRPSLVQQVMQQQQQKMSVNVVHEDGASQPSVFVSYVDQLPMQQLITFKTGSGVVQTLLQ